MKKIILSATIALFSVTAFAQAKNDKNKQREPKEQTSDRVEKDNTDKVKIDKSEYDINNDGIFTPQEKEARKAAKIARKEVRKTEREMDRNDDGLLNGSKDKNNHGREVSGTAKGTVLEGREKGGAVSEVARTNGKSGDEMKRGGDINKPAKVSKPAKPNKPAKTAKPAGSRKPAAAGRKMK